MKRSQFRLLADILRDYHRLEKHIESLREEILYPLMDTDENIGGGKSNTTSRAVENSAIRLTEHRALKHFERQYQTITHLLAEFDSETVRIITRMYLQPYNSATLDALSLEMNVSTATIKRKREAFFVALSEELGMYTMNDRHTSNHGKRAA